MPDEKDWKELLPPEGHADVGKEAWKVLEAVVHDKENLGLPTKWQRYYELRKNKHWKSQATGSVNLVTANLIYTHIQRVVNTMTDNDPSFNIVQMQDENQPEGIYDNLQKAAESWWIDTEQADDFARTVTNGENYGICVEKVVFNPDLESGLGEAETIIVDPFHFGFFPVKMTDPKRLQQADAILHFYPIPVRQVKRDWGEKAADVKPDNDLIKELGDSRREVSTGGQGQRGMLVSLSNVAKTLLNWGKGNAPEDEETIICELWVRDRSDETKYPGNIRRVTVCNGGKIVLDDRPNPSINMDIWTQKPEEAAKTYLFDKFPFSAANPIPDTSNFWGMADLDQLEQLNLEVDKALSQLILFKDRAARQKLINPRTSGVENEEFTNAPGLIRPNNAQEAAAIRWLGGPETPIDIQQVIQIMKDLFFLIAGTFDLDQAQVGKDVIAFKAIAALMERAATMMRGKIRAYGRMLRERGRMYLSHVMNFYTEERWITTTDPKTGQMISKKIPPGTSMIVPAKLTVVSGSTMPVSRVQRREEAIALADKGMIDQQALLEALDTPNRNEIIKRMNLGALGNALQKLQATGMPPEIIDVLGQIMSLEDKEFEKAAKAGMIPTMQDILTVAMQGGGQPPDPAKQAERAEAQAKAEKLASEAALIAEKILTERVKQQQILKGIEFDEETLAMERAKIVSQLEHDAKASYRDDFKTGMEAAKITTGAMNKPGYNEKGLRSNNSAE